MCRSNAVGPCLGVGVEEALFDRSGCPVAYIADDGEHSIYLWCGHAVAYLLGDCVFGWNGRHLGFFSYGVLCDIGGRRVGSTGASCQAATHAEPTKPAKHVKHVRYSRYEPSDHPDIRGIWSTETLEDFLKQGSVVPI